MEQRLTESVERANPFEVAYRSDSGRDEVLETGSRHNDRRSIEAQVGQTSD